MCHANQQHHDRTYLFRDLAGFIHKEPLIIENFDYLKKRE